MNMDFLADSRILILDIANDDQIPWQNRMPRLKLFGSALVTEAIQQSRGRSNAMAEVVRV